MRRVRICAHAPCDCDARGRRVKLKIIHLMSDATSRHEVKVSASAETQPLEFPVVAAKAEVSVRSLELVMFRGWAAGETQSRNVAERLVGFVRECDRGGEGPLRCLGGSRE